MASRGQPLVEPEDGVRLLWEQIEKARELVKQQTIHQGDFHSWDNTTANYVERAFGENHPNVADFSTIGPPGNHTWDSTRWSQHFAEVLHIKIPALVGYIEQLKTQRGSSQQAKSDAATATKEVLLLIHGIRDFGEWEHMVADILEQTSGVKVHPLSYGRFDALRFWCPIWTRMLPIKKLLWRINAARSEYPSAKLSVIAHSYGTYAIGSILKDHPHIRLHGLSSAARSCPRNFGGIK